MDALVRASRPDVVFRLGTLTHVGTSWGRGYDWTLAVGPAHGARYRELSGG